MAAEGDAKPREVDALAGPAYGGDDTAPVGVRAGNRRLDEGRIGDGQRDAAGGSRIDGTSDVDTDQLLRPLPIPHDLQRQIEQYNDSGRR